MYRRLLLCVCVALSAPLYATYHYGSDVPDCYYTDNPGDNSFSDVPVAYATEWDYCLGTGTEGDGVAVYWMGGNGTWYFSGPTDAAPGLCSDTCFDACGYEAGGCVPSTHLADWEGCLNCCWQDPQEPTGYVFSGATYDYSICEGGGGTNNPVNLAEGCVPYTNCGGGAG
jgi:hypothetical protein